MSGTSKVCKLLIALVLSAASTFGYSSVEQNGNTLGFDEAGRLDCVFGPHGGLTTFDYDDAGNLSSRRDAEGAETDYEYDELNRLVSITNEGVEVATFDHDPNGNVVSAVSGN